MRTFKIYSQQCSNMQYSITNNSHHAVYYILRTYLFYNWKFVPFDLLHPFHPLHTWLWHLPRVLSICELRVSICFCFLDSTYKVRSYGICLCLTYFTWHNALRVHPCCCKWQDFLLFYGWVISHFIYVPHLLYPFICWWTQVSSMFWLL